MRNPLPTNVELLIYLANQTGHTYQDAYVVWREVHEQPEAYLITEVILGIAKRYRLTIMLAVMAWRQGPDSYIIRGKKIIN